MIDLVIDLVIAYEYLAIANAYWRLTVRI